MTTTQPALIPTDLDDAARLRLEQAQAPVTRVHHTRPGHLCWACVSPVPLDRKAFDAIRLAAARDACAYCLDASPCGMHL